MIGLSFQEFENERSQKLGLKAAQKRNVRES